MKLQQESSTAVIKLRHVKKFIAKHKLIIGEIKIFNVFN